AVGVLAGCGGGGVPETGASSEVRRPGVVVGELGRELVRGMSLGDRVGQLFLPAVGSAGEGVELQRRYRVGGFVLPAEQMRTPRGTARLANRLQAAARIPLLIGADEEGERFGRPEFTTRFPGAMALGAARSQELARRAAATTGTELRSAGITLDFAPVAGAQGLRRPASRRRAGAPRSATSAGPVR
ncbi:glycoside hydrolase family 3 N-terminal domain-containing protein, partial [Actinocorallia lasiicapitis]